VGGKIEGGPNEGCAFGFGKSFGPKTKRKIAKVKSFKASEAFSFFLQQHRKPFSSIKQMPTKISLHIAKLNLF